MDDYTDEELKLCRQRAKERAEMLIGKPSPEAVREWYWLMATVGVFIAAIILAMVNSLVR